MFRIALVYLFLLGTVLANEAHFLQLYQPKEGHRFLVKKQLSMQQSVDAGAFQRSQTEREEMEYQVKILKVEQGIAKEVEVKLIRWTKQSQEGNQKKEENYPVKDVRIKLTYQKEEAPPTIQVLEGKLSNSIQEKIKNLFRHSLGSKNYEKSPAGILPSPDFLFFPKKPVKIGESWNIDIEKVLKEMKIPAKNIDKSKSKGSAKLEKLVQGSLGNLAEYFGDVQIFLKKLEGLPEIPGTIRMKIKGQATTDGKSPEKKFDLFFEMKIEGKVEGNPLKVLTSFRAKLKVENLK